ncbi:odorant receptor 46a-like [Leptopilina boulardi]|uniref:odorant receptor 46a-like n=1 Tax=Leptopilina boulardi TaxID=63433 RepID=UPI0021F60C9A|nr:odorant receptor 46a-like [Leptopilina boulardi]
MDILPSQFTSLWLCGLWEDNVKSSLERKFYRFIVLLLIHCFTLSEIIQFFRTCESLEHFVEIYPSLTFIIFCWKVVNFIIKKNDMREILNEFRHHLFKPSTIEENLIVDKYYRKSQKIFKFIITIFTLCGISIALTPLLKWKEKIMLPFNLYYPFDVSSPIIFTTTYAFESLLNSFSIIINVTLDTTVYGFMLITIGQFELCACRLENSSVNETNGISLDKIKEYVNHHVLVLKIVKQIESFFMVAVLPFFLISLLTFCTIIFQIAQQKSLLDGNLFQYIMLIQYVTCVLSQIFLYCWYGCLIDEKSKDVSSAVYSSNWVQSNYSNRRNLLLMLLIAERGSSISFQSLCTLNLQTFGWVIKTSYAAVNLLNKVDIS